MKIEKLLTKHFCEVYQIEKSGDYSIEYVEASELLVPERMDLIAKYKYVECYEKCYDIAFFKELYVRHIEAFSLGKFTEPGDPNKVSIENYLNTFHSLIDHIKINGINPALSIIPVGRNNVIMDGAHRVAIALYFGLKVPIVRFEQLYYNFDTTFFYRRKLDRKYLDYMVTEYIRLKKDIYIACLYPAAGKEKESKTIAFIKEKATILYRKSIHLTYEGLRYFIIQLYENDSNQWLGTYENHYEGAIYKQQPCSGTEPLRIFVLECDKIDKIKILKEEVRELYQIGKHSIHITDTKEEAVSLSNIVLNENSIHCLNYGKPDYYIKFNKKLDRFKQKLISNHFSLSDFVIDSSSVMGLYALRDVSDIDFITLAKEYDTIEDNINSNHHLYLDFHNKNIENLVLNPDNYLVYQDLKFITLNVCRSFKKNRDERKDRFDIELIDTILGKGRKHKFRNYFMWYRKKKRAWFFFFELHVKHKILNKVKKTVRYLLLKMGLLTKCKNFIHKYKK